MGNNMISRETIYAALSRLSDELGKNGSFGEINIVGGTAMVIAFNARLATKDVDAIFEPSSLIRTLAKRIAPEFDLPTDWLNDSVKGFLSPAGDFESVPTMDFPNLRVLAPTPNYMLAMKLLAARSGIASEQGPSDAQDIAFLLRFLGLRDSDDVMKIVQRYYDPSRMLPRSLYLLDEILEQLQAQDGPA